MCHIKADLSQDHAIIIIAKILRKQTDSALFNLLNLLCTVNQDYLDGGCENHDLCLLLLHMTWHLQWLPMVILSTTFYKSVDIFIGIVCTKVIQIVITVYY